MCGICGATSDPDGMKTAAMNARLRHRGPDDDGLAIDPEAGVALGARRLSIIDVEGGHQPLSNEDDTVWAVLNGEIYNHPELQERLRARGHQLRSGTDTEVLVHLYEDYGDDLVHALEGMYAFAVWDRRRRRLLLARDRFGEKPLFYACHGSDFAFASELTALRAGQPQLAELDPEAVDAFFVLGYLPGELAVAAQARQLPAAHRLVWSAQDPVPRLHRYWSLPDAPVAGGERFEALAAETSELLERSVRSRLISDVPLGVFLSGGIDSTLVAALAARHAPGVRSFTVTYDVGEVGEGEQARASARRIGTEHHELVLGASDIAALVPRVAGALDQPLADPALVALHAVAGFAREHVTVAVGGEGADELFGGYPRYRWLELADRLDTVVPAQLAQGLAEMLRAGPSDRAGRLGDVLGRVGVPRSGLPGKARRLADVLGRDGGTAARHLDWVTDRRRAARAALYGPALKDVISRDVALADARSVLDDTHGAVADRLMRLDVTRWLADDVLVKADRASMLASLELRTPFLHRELAEHAARIPAATHLKDGGKALLRAVLRDVAPGQDATRSKTAFRVPLADWLRGPLASLVDERLGEGPVIEEGWLERGRLRALTAEHRGGADHSAVLWPALMLALWMESWRRPAAGRPVPARI